MQPYFRVWQVLEDLALELKKRSKLVPQETIADLKSARTMISVYERDPTYSENVIQVESLLGKIEANLIYVAETHFGRAFADDYQRKIVDARIVSEKNTPPFPSRFIPDIPSGEHWMRFTSTDTSERKDIEELVKKLDLSHRLEAESLIIHGDEKRIKELVKMIAEKTGKRKKK